MENSGFCRASGIFTIIYNNLQQFTIIYKKKHEKSKTKYSAKRTKISKFREIHHITVYSKFNPIAKLAENPYGRLLIGVSFLAKILNFFMMAVTLTPGKTGFIVLSMDSILRVKNIP